MEPIYFCNIKQILNCYLFNLFLPKQYPPSRQILTKYSQNPLVAENSTDQLRVPCTQLTTPLQQQHHHCHHGIFDQSLYQGRGTRTSTRRTTTSTRRTTSTTTTTTITTKIARTRTTLLHRSTDYNPFRIRPNASNAFN